MALPLVGALGILRAAGLTVVEYSGWATRARPGTFAPVGLMVHHDASPPGPSPDSYADFLFRRGRPGLTAPLCQFWIDYVGRWWVGAAGRASHAGEGDGWRGITAGNGNALTGGIELDLTTNERQPAAQLAALQIGCTALFRAYRWDVDRTLTAHKEYAAGRKIDPAEVDMSKLRATVTRLLAGGVPSLPPPKPPPLEEDTVTPEDQAAIVAGVVAALAPRLDSAAATAAVAAAAARAATNASAAADLRSAATVAEVRAVALDTLHTVQRLAERAGRTTTRSYGDPWDDTYTGAAEQQTYVDASGALDGARDRPAAAGSSEPA